MTIDKELVNQVVSALNIPEEFGLIDGETTSVTDDYENIIASNFKGYLASGVTKLVIVLFSLDYVIKIPYSGEWDKNYDDDEDELIFTPFEYANDLAKFDIHNSNWDYCENEVTKYNIAKEHGFADFFPETVYVGNGVYAQEKCMEIDEEEYTPSESSRALCRTNWEHFRGIDTDWVALAIDWYGFDRVMKFFDFIDEYRMNEDLHRGNIGFRMNGAPIILDFSGYRD